MATELYDLNNYRKALIAQAADYHWIMRDAALEQRGMLVTLRIPKHENNVNEYSDFIDEEDDYDVTQTIVEPQFEKYELTLSLLGQDMERDYPLEIAIMSQVHMPRNSILLLPEINSAGDVVTKEWRILSTEIKQVGHIYTRIAHATPARVYQRIETSICDVTMSVYIKVTDYEIYETEEEVMSLPAEGSNRVEVEVLDSLMYAPYGIVESYTRMRGVVLTPSISD